MTRKCSKKAAALTWALLECLFFSSVVLGWTWLAIVLRSDGYFKKYCNVTVVNSTPSPEPKESLLPNVEAVVKLAENASQNSPSQQKKPPCRPRRNVHFQNSTTKFTWERNELNLLAGGSGSLTRDIYVEAEWTTKSDVASQQRFKRGDSSNMSSFMSSLRSNPMSAASITQVQKYEENGNATRDHQNSAYCLEQNEKIRIMFAVACISRDLITFPLGFFFDYFGTTRTRLLTV